MSHPFASYVDARRDEIVETLRRVVEMESPSQEKARVDAVIDVFQAAYRDAGFVTRRIPQTDYGDHLVADLPGGGGPRVLLVGHADTVYPPGTLATMPLRRDGDRLLGPAVMDMKGGLVCMLYAIRGLLVVRGAVRGSLRVVVNSDEEPGSPSSRGLWPELTQGVDWALICEPARPDGALVLSRKGCGIFRVRVRGQAAHAGAEPEKGASAIRALARKILDIEGLAAPAIGTTINTGVVRGGTHPYVVPEEAEAVIDIRVSTLAERDRVLAGMQTVAAREDVPRTQAVLEGQFHRPPSEPVPGTERLAVVIEEEGRALDVPIRWAPQTGGVGDANNITACGVPTVDGMGPVGGRAHSPEEYMEIPTLFQKTALLAAVLDRLVGREVLRRV